MGLLLRPRTRLLRLAAGAATAADAATPGSLERAEAPPPRTDITLELERLARLHESGALPYEEFTAAKARVLGVRR